VSTPGRSCPLHYRYSPTVFASATATRCDTLYVVGGLYGNEPALAQVLALFAQEPGTAGVHKRLVFNGDFNWFNVDPAAFARINTCVLGFDALRGNVETEIARMGAAGGADSDTADADDGDTGCGCAYPAWVGDGVVQRSNRILQRLHRTARGFAALQQRLAALPMHQRVDVGALRLGIVHGDAESLAGWGFAQEHLQDAAHRATVRGWFDAAQVDAFACSHTCLPVFHTLPMPGRSTPAVVLNNGATGMPNFAGSAVGLFTRVALQPFAGPPAACRHGLVRAGVHINAVAVDASTPQWQTAFVQQWPPGSDAHTSYWQRICQGPAFHPAQALETSP
jgi:hypothetical protein